MFRSEALGQAQSENMKIPGLERIPKRVNSSQETSGGMKSWQQGYGQLEILRDDFLQPDMKI